MAIGLYTILSAMEGTAGGTLDGYAYNHRARAIIEPAQAYIIQYRTTLKSIIDYIHPGPHTDITQAVS